MPRLVIWANKQSQRPRDGRRRVQETGHELFIDGQSDFLGKGAKDIEPPEEKIRFPHAQVTRSIWKQRDLQLESVGSVSNLGESEEG